MATAKQNFDISKLVHEVYELHSYAAAQKGLRYTFSVSHKVPRALYGDLSSIKQALSVIINMAIEDSTNGTVELNVDLQTQNSAGYVVKFSVNESSKRIPKWFSVLLETAKAKSKSKKVS